MSDFSKIRKIVEQQVYNILKNQGDFLSTEKKVKVNASNRHMHVRQEDLEVLFGKGFSLEKVKDLIQPGEFASAQTVTVAGPKGVLQNVRILGPVRNYTQIEISVTDSYTLGVKNVPLRDSGNIGGTSPITIIGPEGTISIKEGLIFAKRHVHMSPEEAAGYGLKNGDLAKLRISGDRETVFEKVLVRVSPKYLLEAHLDTDEANAAMVGPDTWGTIEKY